MARLWPNRRFQFRLGTLLVAMTVFCVWLGLRSQRAHEQRRAAEAIQAAGGTVWYDYQRRGRNAAPGGPAWLRRATGDEYFQEIDFVDLSKARLSDELLAMVGTLPKLRGLDLSESTVTDRQLAYLSGLVTLEELKLGGTEFGNAGLAHLKPLVNLRKVFLTRTKVSDAGLVHLKPLVNLQELWLWSTKVADRRLEALKELPKLGVLRLARTPITAVDVRRALPNLPRQRYRNMLDARCARHEFVKTALQDVVDILAEENDVEIEFDQGVVLGTAITGTFDGCKTGDMVSGILEPIGLTHTVRHEVLVVTTQPVRPTTAEMLEIENVLTLPRELGDLLLDTVDAHQFIDMPLQDVLQIFRDRYKIPIRVDAKAFAAAGRGTKDPVRTSLERISVASALGFILDKLDLTCGIEDDGLVIRPAQTNEQRKQH